MSPVGWLLTAAVPQWLDDAPDALREVAGAVGATADQLGAVRASLRSVLGASAVAVGWSGPAARAASGRADDRCDQLGALRDLVSALGDELARAAGLLDERRAELRRLSARARWVPFDPLATVWTGREMERVIDDAQTVDRAAGGSLDLLADCLRGMAQPAYAAQWIEPIAPPGSVLWLREGGALPPLAVADVARWAAALPAGPAATERLRSALYALPNDDLAAALESHPGLSSRLASDVATPPVLASALAIAVGPGRAGAVREAMHGVPAAERRALALLYPRLIGALDGVPVAERIAANRLLVTAALDAELARRADTIARLDRRDAHTGPIDLVMDKVDEIWDRVNDIGPIRSFVDDFDGDPLARLAASDQRIELYRSLLADGRQVLAFDPRGDGVIVELFGSLDDRTEHVAVMVPGTFMGLDSYAGWADLARDFAGEADRLATISWVGGDFPDTLSAAALPSYAEDAAPRLRDFMAGLDVAAGADATVLGYSYGGAVVGVAERVGLVADRVLHVESAGAGARVETLADYGGGVSEHYTMTAPGDPIKYVRGVDLGPFGHGADPDAMAGFIQVPTGCYGPTDPDRAGERISGLSSHWDVFSRGSTAWDSMLAVMTGQPILDDVDCRS